MTAIVWSAFLTNHGAARLRDRRLEPIAYKPGSVAYRTCDPTVISEARHCKRSRKQKLGGERGINTPFIRSNGAYYNEFLKDPSYAEAKFIHTHLQIVQLS